MPHQNSFNRTHAKPNYRQHLQQTQLCHDHVAVDSLHVDVNI